MHSILICIPSHPNEAVLQRARGIQTHLERSSHGRTQILPTDPRRLQEVLQQAPSAVVLSGFCLADMLAFTVLRAPCVWDMVAITAEQMSNWLSQPQDRSTLQQLVAGLQGFAEIDTAVALLLEDELQLGITRHGLDQALAACRERVAVILGAGLGNMIYGTSMIRWLSEELRAPVDLIIHDRFDAAVHLFAAAPWLNAVYPGFEYLAGRHYRLLISTITGGAMKPPFQADQVLWLNEDHSYNEEGRFIPEPRLNFLGLEKLFGRAPGLLDDLPMPFIRDITYSHPGDRVLGVANGQKSSSWAKREWQHTSEAVVQLQAQGWDVRSFGLPDEYVEGAEDYTGIPMRQVVQEIAKCSYFLSHDGGLCHIAEALGVPTVWLFGSTGSMKNGPVYAHSPQLLSYRSCGPCLYKIDWVRCQEPTCMEDLTVSHVLEAVDQLRHQVENTGYAPQPRALDSQLLAYEILAQHRPPPLAEQPRYAQERASLLGRDRNQLTVRALQLFNLGDIAGAAALASHALNLHPDSLALRFLLTALRQAWPGPTPISGPLETLTVSPLVATEMEALLQELESCDLGREIRRFVVHSALRCWIQSSEEALLNAFLAALLKSVTFSRHQIRLYQRFLERFGNLAEIQTLRSIEFEPSPAQKRMQNLLHRPVAELLEQVASEMGATLGQEPQAVLDAAMVPHFKSVDSKLHFPVTLEVAGLDTFTLTQQATVLLLVPHVCVKHAVAASTSNLILQQATRLAMLGLRPVVLTCGFDDIRDLWTMRDSVTYVQGHRDWAAEQWQTLFEFFDPALCLAYGGVDRDLNLPEVWVQALINVDMAGLVDRQGLLPEFIEGNRWLSDRCAPAPKPDRRTLRSEALSEALLSPPDSQRPVNLARPKFFVLLPDAACFMTFGALAGALPEIDFTLMTDFSYRGIEKNVTQVPIDELTPGRLEPDQILMQFSSRPIALSAEIIRHIETGGRALAGARLHEQGALTSWLVNVDTPDTIGAWISAIRKLLRQAQEDSQPFANTIA